MMRRTWASLGLVVTLLLAASLACSLDTDGASPDGSLPSATDIVDSGTGTTPTVTILEPANGQAVPRDQAVDIRVSTDSTATSFLLNVNGQVASTRSLPGNQTGPAEAILTWNTPNRTGSYTLQVVAFNGSLASDPVTLTLEVSASAASTTGSVTSACTGKALVSQLNFRDGPSTSAQQLGQFEVGETVSIIGRNASSTWYRAQRANAQQVWVINNAQWFQVEGDCGDLPLGETG